MSKVIFLVPTLSIGGGERVVSELSLNLPKSIDKVIVLFQKEISYPYKGRVISLNVPILQSPFLKIYNYYFLGLLKLKKIIKLEKPDYVMSFGLPANIMNILSNLGVWASERTIAARYPKSIVRIDSFYSSLCHGFVGKIYKFLIKILFNKAYMVIDVSKESAEDLAENFGVKKEKIKVIYNPLNVEEIEKLAKEPLEKIHQEIFKKPVIINMGRMSKQKGQWYLIRVFKEVKRTIKEAQLVILGSGELRPELKKIVKDLGIENDVHLLGWQSNPFKFLTKSKVFVLSSLWEGLPYVVLEAMACGLPIISVDCKSGPREILAPNTDPGLEAKNIEYAEYGVLVEKENKELLIQAAIKILSDENLLKKYKTKSKERALNFDIKNIIKEWKFLAHE